MSAEIRQNEEDVRLMVSHGVSLEEAEVDGHFGGDSPGHSHPENASSEKDEDFSLLGPAPVFSDDLPPDLKHRFDTIMDELQSAQGFLFAPTVEERERLTENFLQELRSTLQQFPILSRTVCSRMGKDLLCQALHLPGDFLALSQVLKCLIEANPHGLLWKHEGIANARLLVASDHARLVLWIAKHYDWVLRDERSGLLTGDDSGDSPLVGMAWEVMRGHIGVTEI